MIIEMDFNQNNSIDAQGLISGLLEVADTMETQRSETRTVPVRHASCETICGGFSVSQI
jgi:hypothetical protein